MISHWRQEVATCFLLNRIGWHVIMGGSLLVKIFICELLGYEILEMENFLWKITHITSVLSLQLSVVTEQSCSISCALPLG